MQAAPQEQIASAYSTNFSTMNLSSPAPVVLVLNRDAVGREFVDRECARPDRPRARPAHPVRLHCRSSCTTRCPELGQGSKATFTRRRLVLNRGHSWCPYPDKRFISDDYA